MRNIVPKFRSSLTHGLISRLMNCPFSPAPKCCFSSFPRPVLFTPSPPRNYSHSSQSPRARTLSRYATAQSNKIASHELTHTTGLLKRARTRWRFCERRRWRRSSRLSRREPPTSPCPTAPWHVWQPWRNASSVHDPRSCPALPVVPPTAAAVEPISYATARRYAPSPRSPIRTRQQVELN